jgi:pimeloyl-ACP methyl ester carboxylesterase
MEQAFVLAGPYGSLEGKINYSRCDFSHPGSSEVTAADLFNSKHVSHGEAVASERLLIIAHGFRGSMDGGGRAQTLAEQAAKAGFQVIRFNFTDSQILSKQVEEFSLVVDYGLKILKPRLLYLLGRSLGGATAIAYLAQKAQAGRILTAAGPVPVQLGGLILWSTPHDLAKTFRVVLGEENFEKLQQGCSVTLEDYKGKFTLEPETVRDMLKYDLKACLAHIKNVPSLIVHGTADTVVSLEQPQANYEALGEPKKLVWIPGGDHSFVTDSSAATSAVLEWLRQH